MQVAIALFPRLTALDAIGPYEVLQRVPQLTPVFVAERRGEVRTENGFLGLTADAAFDEVPAPDVVLVPGGIGSHVTPEVPGSIHEGGELGYALTHAYGAAFDDPNLVVFCVVGDGAAETGPLAASWHANKLLDPVSDGVVVPILHLNGYKIANPTLLARIPTDELTALIEGYGYRPILVEGDDPARMHQLMAAAMDDALDDIERIHARARRLAEEFDPGSLDARVVLGRLGEREERLEVLLETTLQRRVGDLAIGERFVGHRQREHVWEDPRSQMLERHAKGPEAPIAAGKGR